MVKFYSSNFTYDYPFPAVSLAYFLRYPNPYSTHVLSTDVIERSFDAATQRLTTTRLHLKRSKLPSAVLKLLPSSLIGASSSGDSQSYILERSTVDVKEGWMRTENRNLDFTGVLDVVERQVFERQKNSPSTPESSETQPQDWSSQMMNGKTDVTTSVTLYSPIGTKHQTKWRRARAAANNEETEEKVGFFRSWGTERLQRSIELIGLRKAERSQPNAKEGMKIVLSRLRQGGLVAVLEGMRKDKEEGLLKYGKK